MTGFYRCLRCGSIIIEGKECWLKTEDDTVAVCARCYKEATE